MDEFEQLYQKYFPRIYAFIYNLCKDHNLSEELTQETFYQAFSSIHRFRGDCEVFTWLASIAKHTYYKYLRKKKLHYEDISLDLITDVFCESNSDGPEEYLERKTVTDSIRNLVNRMPGKYRDVVMLRCYADLSFKQVGAALHINENSAKTIYFRAKKMLMEDLKNDSVM